MTVLMVGGTGATGRLLVQQLLQRGERVRAIVRTPDGLSELLDTQPNLSLIYGSISELSDAELAAYVEGWGAVASCLGHRVSFRGMFGPPRRLVTDAVRRLCRAVRRHRPDRPVRFALMNTAGNRNRDLDEPLPFLHRLLERLLRGLLPPHADNVAAAEFLRTRIGRRDEYIEWVAVRPDALRDETAVSAYDVYPSPTRSALLDAGATSRINVAHFMARLLTEEALWNRWKGQMPVIYNRA